MAQKPTHKRTSKSTSSLGNPALATLATSKAGQEAISKTANTGGKVLKWVLIGGVVIGVTAVGYKIYQARFVRMLQNTNYPRPTISQSQARLKADALYNAMHGMGANFNQVKNQLIGLSYNDFVLVYNAFGRRETAWQGVNPLNFFNIFRIGIKGMTLTEWLLDQFKSANQLADLRAILPHGII